jgi:hypothetical protein
MTANERIARQCEGCGVSDTHAHHVQFVGIIHPVTKEGVDLSISKHIQCCAADGCEVCSTHVEFAPDEGIGDQFTSYQQNPSDDHLTALTERHGILTSQGV